MKRLREISKKSELRARNVVESIRSSPYSMKYCGFSMVELFPMERYRDVIAAAADFFPDLDRLNFLDEHSHGYMDLGSIYRSEPQFPRFGVTDGRIVPALPSWVERVDLHLSRIYDSTFIVIVDVVTNSQIDRVISKQLGTIVPQPIELLELKKISRWGLSYSMSSEGIAFSSSYQKLLSSLRSSIEDQVFARILPRGYFRDHKRMLPAIELIEISGPDIDAANWVDATLGWRQSLDLAFDGDYLSGPSIAVDIPPQLPIETSPRWRVIFTPTFSAPRGYSRPTADREVSVAIQSNLRRAAHSLAAIGHQGALASLLAEFRRRIFASASYKIQIPRQTALYEAISRERLFFERNKREMVEKNAYPEDQILSSLTYKSRFYPNIEAEETGDITIRNSIEWGYKRLSSGMDEIRAHFSDVLSVRNASATYWLTVIVIVIAVTSLVVSLRALDIAEHSNVAASKQASSQSSGVRNNSLKSFERRADHQAGFRNGRIRSYHTLQADHLRVVKVRTGR